MVGAAARRRRSRATCNYLTEKSSDVGIWSAAFTQMDQQETSEKATPGIFITIIIIIIVARSCCLDFHCIALHLYATSTAAVALEAQPATGCTRGRISDYNSKLATNNSSNSKVAAMEP